MVTHRQMGIRENVFGADADCPVKVRHDRRRDIAPSTLVVHPEWELQFILGGEGVYFIGGNRYPLEPNVVFAIPPEQAHYFALAPGTQAEKWKMIFLPAFLRKQTLTRALESLPCRMALSESEASALVVLFHGLKHELEAREVHWKALLRLKVAELIWVLHRASLRPVPPPVIHPLAQQLVAYLEEHFRGEVTLARLASDFGYSESYLSHVFKDHTGISIVQYVLQRRVAEARRLLEREPAITVAAVGEQVGFGNYGAFNRTFKTMVGLTPAVYRRNAHPHSRM